MGPSVHLLWDTTTSNDAAASTSIADTIRLIASERTGLGGCVEQATILLRKPVIGTAPELPDGWCIRVSQQVIADANVAMESSADCGAYLLVLLESSLLSSEALGALIESFRWDPHFGVAVPRFCEPLNGELYKLRPDLGESAILTYSRRVLTEIPEFYILPEFVSPCLLVRREVVASLSGLENSYDTLAGALQHYLCSVRRAGFRTAVVNRAVSLWAANPNTQSVIISQADNRKLLLAHQDAGSAQAELAENSLHLHEALLARLYSSDIRRRKSMLLDLRGVPAYVNGTVEAVLAICDALHASNLDWNISILAVAAPADYHGLRSRYPSWTVLTREGRHFFTIALRLSQPWKFQTLVELHEMALLNFYLVLDTIAWDILFEAPATLGATWTFLSDYADGLFYNSHYTRKHFAHRFGQSSATRDHVLHHSFDQRDYVDPALEIVADEFCEQHIFLLGNTYDHKHLKTTVDLLSSAFPSRKLVVLGLASHPGENVECLQSGKIAANKIDKLFAGARLVVFPSLYEGFGFPVLKGLSYGRDVIAQHSELLLEVASQYQGPGKLFSFSTPVELVNLIGNLLHSVTVDSILLGSALGNGQQPKNWAFIVKDLISVIEAQMDNPKRLWPRRDRAIRQLEAYRE